METVTDSLYWDICLVAVVWNGGRSVSEVCLDTDKVWGDTEPHFLLFPSSHRAGGDGMSESCTFPAPLSPEAEATTGTCHKVRRTDERMKDTQTRDGGTPVPERCRLPGGSREQSSAIWGLLGACWSDPPATHSHWGDLRETSSQASAPSDALRA